MNVLHCSNLLSVDINCIRSVTVQRCLWFAFTAAFKWVGSVLEGPKGCCPRCAQSCSMSVLLDVTLTKIR